MIGYFFIVGLLALFGYGGYHLYLTIHDPSSKYYTFAWVVFIILMIITLCTLGPLAVYSMNP